MGASIQNTLNSYQISGASTLLNGLVAYYKLEESSGHLVDSVNGYNTTSETGLAYQQTGKLNYCIDSSTTDQAIIGDNSNFDLTNVTVAGWMKSTGSWTPLFSNFIHSGSNFYGYGLYFNNGYPAFEIATDTTEVIATADDPANDGNWHFVVGTYDHSNVKIYVDGDLQTDQPSSSMNIVYTDAVVRIGYIDGTQATGSLDEIGIWNRALTQAEVTELWNSGTGKTYPFS